MKNQSINELVARLRSKMAELDFEKIFDLQMLVMKLNQCHPDTKINFMWVFKNMFTMGPYTANFFLLVYSIRYFLRNSEYFYAFNNSVPLTYYVCMTFYFCLLILHRPKLGHLIAQMKQDYVKARQFDERRKSIVFDYAIRGRRIMRLWGILMVSTISSFVIKCIVLSIYYSIKSGEVELVPFHELYYPFNITEIREENRIVFGLTFFSETYFTTTCVVIFFCTIPLGPIYILHACGQMDLIIIKFENLFESDHVDEKLNDIVQSLQYVYSFVEEINECIVLMYEVLLKQNIILLPFTSYAMIQSIRYGEMQIEYVGVFMQGIFTSSLPCYYGDLLMQKGEEVRLSAYNCGWERVHIPSARKTLLIILTRALKPVAIRSIFSTVNLDTLTNVYRQAYTIFNLMTAM